MGRQSSIKQLPPALREQVDALLKAGVTIETIVAKLTELGAPVSRSAVGRYKLELDAVGERLRRSREISAAFVERLGAVPDGRQGRLIGELLQTVVFDLLVPRDGGEAPELEPQDIFRLAAAIKDLTAAEKISADRELRIRKEIEAEQTAKLAKLEKEAGQPGAGAGRGIDAATLRRVREEIYGLPPS